MATAGVEEPRPQSVVADGVPPTDIRDPGYFHKVVDCQWACPAHTPVPEYIRLIAAGRYGNQAVVIGWALDPDTTDTTGVLFFNNGRMAWLAPAMHNWDPLAGRFPRHGTNRLFFSLMPINKGRNDICAYALNVGPGNPATFLGCKVVSR